MPETAQMLCLNRCKAGDAGHALGLKSGDLLIAVDGKRWTGTINSLKTRLSDGKDTVTLTFQRGDAVWSVLTERLDLGQWGQAPLPVDLSFDAFSTDLLYNWEIVANSNATYDLFALRPSLFALVAPGVWLAYHRLWTLLATLCAAMAVALPAGAPLVVGLWIAVGVHLWRNGAAHLRVDRAAEGFHRVAVVAARGETEAIAICETLYPGARFRFDGTSKPFALPAST